jgi:hypothetical protein
VVSEGTNVENNDRITAKQFLWAGRIIAFGLYVFIMTALLVGSFSNNHFKPSFIDYAMTLVPLAGLITSWWKQLISSVLLFLTSIGLSILCFLSRETWGWWFVLGLPYLIASIFIFSSWWLSKKKG